MIDDIRGTQQTAFAPATGPIVHLARIERYWRELSGAGHLPARSDVDPVQIDGALTHSFIMERVAPGVGRIRVAGQQVADFVGTEVRGMPLSALFGAGSRAELADWLERLWDLPALVDLPVYARRSIGRPRIEGRLLLLPLLDGTGEANRALGAILTDRPAGRSPRHFEIDLDAAPRCEPVGGHAGHIRLAAERLDPVSRGARPSRPAQLRLVVSNG